MYCAKDERFTSRALVSSEPAFCSHKLVRQTRLYMRLYLGAQGSGKACGGPLTEIWCRAIDEDGNTQRRAEHVSASSDVRPRKC